MLLAGRKSSAFAGTAQPPVLLFFIAQLHPMLSPVLRTALRQTLNTELLGVHSISGGDIHRAYRVRTAAGDYFLKSPEQAHGAALLRAEVAGLDHLEGRSPLPVPERIAFSTAPPLLLLTYLPPTPPGAAAWQALGEGLAALHRQTAPDFGFGHDNFIGTLPQSNRRHAAWSAFYAEERLLPQLRAARDAQRLMATDVQHTERLIARLPELLENEPPALIHGDFWSGNFHCTGTDRMYLIDPAVCYASREMDLALARLFGGFDTRFFAAYAAAFPLAPGWADRLPIYQLYYLLAHLNMFGAGYLPGVRRIVREF